jgi:hypothetical protein
MRLPLIAALLLAAGCENLPVVYPPGFGTATVQVQQVRLDFPTGLAITPNKSLLVANGNFSHAFVSGTMLSIPGSAIEAIFDANQLVDCETPAVNPATGVATFPAQCTHQPAEVIQSAVMIGNYAGPITLDDDGTVPARFNAVGGTAFTGSRDTNKLNAVHVAPDGTLTCAAGAGISATDCRQGLLNLDTTSNLDGPFSIVAGDAFIPGRGDTRVMFVSSLIPHVDDIQSGIPITSSEVAVLPMDDPSHPAFTMLGSSQFSAAGIGIGPMLYDPARRRLVLGGCYQRFGSTGAGEPASSKCLATAFNFLRMLSVDAAGTSLPLIYDLYSQVQSNDLSSMVFADPDPVTQAPTALWATMRNPDVLAKIALPLDQSIPPHVLHLVPMPSFPSELVLIPRAGRGDLIAVASERMGAITIYDSDADQVVANVLRIGDTPFGLKLFEFAGDAANPTARLVTGVFAGCSIALVEVPLNNPENATLRGRIGECEE